jgi:hypothetical protein
MVILKRGKINLDGFGGISFIGWSVKGGSTTEFQIEAINLCAPNRFIRKQMLICCYNKQ